MVNNQREMTPFQRQVLVAEYQRQNDKEQDMIDGASEGRQPSGPKQMSGGMRNQRNSANSKTEAIKNSQEEQEKFVNTSVVNNE